jgi:hypothetical protein
MAILHEMTISLRLSRCRTRTWTFRTTFGGLSLRFASIQILFLLFCKNINTFPDNFPDLNDLSFFHSTNAELGKVTLKSNGDEALSDEFLLKSNDDEALNDVFP